MNSNTVNVTLATDDGCGVLQSTLAPSRGAVAEHGTRVDGSIAIGINVLAEKANCSQYTGDTWQTSKFGDDG
ncbi:hypothetical protein [Rhizobium sp. BK060]|nr:hypothetical protein [Rhizobium sp. BK060]MBB3395442.1 hypothetical protein [Rhizobium sp. BK060]